MAKESLNATQRGKIRRLALPGDEPAEEGKEINVVPFLDIITNVLMFVLATVAVTFTATIDVGVGRASTVQRPADAHPLDLAVLVVNDGFSVKTQNGNVATIPKKGGAYDYSALRDCAAKLKASDPAFAQEEGVTVSANPQIPYEVMIATFDALRTSAQGNELFPNVAFGVAR